LFIVWVRSFTKMLPSVKFAEAKVLVFVILRENAKTVQLYPNFQSRLIR